MALALGIEIGGTKLQVGIGDGSDDLLSLVRGSVDASRGAGGVRETIDALIKQAIKQANVSRDELAGIGVGFGGPVDSKRGRVIVSHQIAGWDDYPLAAELEAKWKLPVRLQNDASTAALAEAMLGAGRGCERIFYITVGSGVGGGLVTRGMIDEGQGLGAGEIGHTWVPHPRTGEAVLLESLASGWAIARRAHDAQVFGDEPAEKATGQRVLEAARHGDERATKVIRESAQALAVGVNNVIALLCPEKVIVGGGVSLMGDIWWQPLREAVARRMFKPFAGKCALEPAALGEAVVVLGAVRVGLGDSAAGPR